MTDHDFGDDRDPLLVRPFLLNDSGTLGEDPSTQTWPAATTREVRSLHASIDDDPTRPIPLAAPRRGRRYRRRRRLMIVGSVIVAVVLAAAAAGYAALRPGMHPSVTAALPGSPLPIVTGPTAARGTPSAASTTAPSHRAKPSASATATASRAGSTASAGNAGAGHGSATDGQTTTATASPVQQLAPTLARIGTIRGENGLCLDVAGGILLDDAAVQVSTCNGSGTQLWLLATDGTMRVGAECALIVGDDTVHIVSCDGRSTAQWRISGSTLINAADNKCLTDPAKGTTPGTAVTVTRCTKAANQQWSLP